MAAGEGAGPLEAYLAAMFSYREIPKWEARDSIATVWPAILRGVCAADYAWATGGDMGPPLQHAEQLLKDGAPLGHDGGRAFVEAFLAAVRASSGPDMGAALAAWAAVLAIDPGSVLACKRSSQWAFMLARPREMLALTQRTFEAGPTAPYIGGVHSFALEQNGLFACSERIGRAAVCGPEGSRLDIWAIHAVAHALYYQGKLEEGKAWIARFAGDVEGCGAFMFTHLFWHLALFHVDTETIDEIAQLLRGALWDGLSGAFQSDYWASTGLLGLLWKLELRCPDATAAGIGAEDLQRYWAEGFRRARATLGDGLDAFVSPLYTLVILRAAFRADPEAAPGFAEKLLRAMEAHATGTADQSQRAALVEVWVPVGKAICAVYQGTDRDARAAGDLVRPVLDRLDVLGGSSEQREMVVEFVMVEILQPLRERSALDALLQPRTQLRGAVPFLQRLGAAAAAASP